MRFIAFDTETHLLKAGQFAPRMVCLSYAERGCSHGLMLRDEGLAAAVQWLDSDSVTLVGHNVWFDLAVFVAARPQLMPVVFRKIDRGLVLDTMLRQQLLDVASGELKFFVDEETGELKRAEYSLAALTWRLRRERLPKQDTWRLRYAKLDGVPLADWPADAKTYAIKDATSTLALYDHQESVLREQPWKLTRLEGTRIVYQIPNTVEQHRAAWALYLMSREGVVTDPAAVQSLKAELEADYAEQMAALRPSGLFNITPARALKSGPRKGQIIPEQVSKHMQAIYARVEQAYAGRFVPRTDKGRISTTKKTLEESGDPELAALAKVGGLQKLLTTYVPILESGTRQPIHARFNPLMETGRTSCSKPNLQNPPQKGGVRECFIPRPGRVYGFCDYDTLELRALAQACLDILGYSRMAEALRRGEELHLSLAAEMRRIPLAEAQARMRDGDNEIKNYRQQAKPGNFGFPGGMSAETFQLFAASRGVVLTIRQCIELKDAYFRAFPEMREYFAHVNTLPDPLRQLRSGRIRGGASFTAACNGFFQGLAADGAKEALWRVAYECYVDTRSALYGSRPVLFLHDEIAIETPEGPGAAPACERLAVVMREAMEAWIPDVPIRCGAIMMRRWYKGAEAVRINGVLVPCKPEKVEGKTRWIADLEESADVQAA